MVRNSCQITRTCNKIARNKLKVARNSAQIARHRQNKTRNSVQIARNSGEIARHRVTIPRNSDKSQEIAFKSQDIVTTWQPDNAQIARNTTNIAAKQHPDSKK